MIGTNTNHRSRRILMVIDTLEVGGTERSLLDLCRHLDQAAFSPVVCHLYTGGALAPAFRDAGVPVHAFDISGKYHFARAFRQLSRLVRELDADVIHTMLYRADQVGRAVGRWHRIPVVSSLVGVPHEPVRFDNNPHLSRSKHAVLKRLDRISARWVTRFHSVSHEVQDSYCRHLGIDARRVTVVPRGRSQPATKPAAATRTSLGIDDDTLLLLNVGRLVPQKGQRDLVDAMVPVVAAHPKTRLLIAGDGWLNQELEARIRDHGLTDHITLLGRRHDVPDLLTAADLFVFPTLYEGLPGAVVEAMLSETPIVGSDIASLREALTHTRTAMLVPPQSPQRLAMALLELIGQPAIRKQMAEAARADALERFDILTVTRQIEAIYRDALADVNQ